MHVEGGPREPDPHRGDPVERCRPDRGQRGDRALQAGRAGPAAKRDLPQFPARSEPGGRTLRPSALGVGRVQPAVGGGQEVFRGGETLPGEQPRHEPGERRAALVELDDRGPPGGEGPGRLAAGEAESAGHRPGVEPSQAADRGGGAERPDDARPVPALAAEDRVVEADPHPRRGLQACGQRGEQRPPGGAVGLRDGEGRRHDLRRDVGERRAVDVAHRHRGNQVAVHERRAGERRPPAADDRGVAGLPEGARRGGDLGGLLPLAPGQRAGQRVEEQRLARFPDRGGDRAALQPRGEPRQRPGRLFARSGPAVAHARRVAGPPRAPYARLASRRKRGRCC